MTNRDGGTIALSTKTTRRRTGPRAAIPPLRGLLPLACGIAAWQILGPTRSPYFPRPSEWLQSIANLWGSGALLEAISQTLASFAIALVGAVLIGLVIGLVIGRLVLLDRAVNPVLEFCRVLPPAAVVPLFVLFAGYTDAMKVEVTIFGAIWPVLLNVRSAARGVSTALLDTARSMHLGRTTVIGKILLPAVAPALFVGIRIAAPIVLILVLLVEILTHVNGLGALIADGQQKYMAAQVYGLVAITGIIAFVLNLAVALIEQFFLRYRPATGAERR